MPVSTDCLVESEMERGMYQLDLVDEVEVLPDALEAVSDRWEVEKRELFPEALEAVAERMDAVH